MKNPPPNRSSRAHQQGLFIPLPQRDRVFAMGLAGWGVASANATFDGNREREIEYPANILRFSEGKVLVDADLNVTVSGLPPLRHGDSMSTGNNAVGLRNGETLMLCCTSSTPFFSCRRLCSYERLTAFGNADGEEKRPLPGPDDGGRLSLFVLASNGSSASALTRFRYRSTLRCTAQPYCSWQIVEGPCEPQATQLRDGRVLLLMRFSVTPLMKAYSSDSAFPGPLLMAFDRD